MFINDEVSSPCVYSRDCAGRMECLEELYFSVALEVLAMTEYLSEPLLLSLETPDLAFLTQKRDSAVKFGPASGPVANLTC